MARRRKPLSEQLRDLIRTAEREGITRYEITKRTGISSGQLSRVLHSEGSMRLDTAERIAEACGRRIIITDK